MPLSFSPREQLAHVQQPDYPPSFPVVPVDKGACRLLGPTALVVQGLMGGLVIASLIFKRQREKPMRPWRIWLFDVSKQILGQAFVHGLNLFISDYVAHLAEGNPCDLYFLNVLIDTTIGVGYIYLVLHGADKLFTDHLHLKGFRSGEYGDPPSIAFWGRQAAVYVFTILTMKLFLVALFAAWPGIFAIGEWLLSWTGKSDRVQVVFVMGIFPIIMNVLQFWLIDSIVKASASYAEENTRDNDDSFRQPLFRDPDLGDDDDDTLRSQPRHDIESPPTPPQKSSQRSQGINEDKSFASRSSSTLVEPPSINLHQYPPEPSTSTAMTINPFLSPISPGSYSSADSSASSLKSKKSKRRSPPPPIRRPPPQSNGTNYIISLTPSPTHRPLSSNTTPPSLKARARPRHQTTLSQSSHPTTVLGEPVEQAWDKWTEVDDWAEKVGEEEWTGRRIGVTQETLDIWGTKSAGAGVPVS